MSTEAAPPAEDVKEAGGAPRERARFLSRQGGDVVRGIARSTAKGRDTPSRPGLRQTWPVAEIGLADHEHLPHEPRDPVSRESQRAKDALAFQVDGKGRELHPRPAQSPSRPRVAKQRLKASGWGTRRFRRRSGPKPWP